MSINSHRTYQNIYRFQYEISFEIISHYDAELKSINGYRFNICDAVSISLRAGTELFNYITIIAFDWREAMIIDMLWKRIIIPRMAPLRPDDALHLLSFI